MRQEYFLLIAVTFAACIQAFAIAEQASAVESHRSLRSSSKTGYGDGTTDAETEERMKVSNLGKVTSFSTKESSVVKNMKWNPALTKTLSGNPSLFKSFENNPQLVKTFESLQKDTTLLTRMKSLKKSPSMDKLKTAISKNPGVLTEQNVEKLGAAVLKKPSGKMSEDDRGILFACGVMLLVILGGLITIEVTGSRL